MNAFGTNEKDRQISYCGCQCCKLLFKQEKEKNKEEGGDTSRRLQGCKLSLFVTVLTVL
jgi:hypothetical protein